MIKYYYNKNNVFENISDEYYENDPNCKWVKQNNDSTLCDICDISWDYRDKINSSNKSLVKSFLNIESPVFCIKL